MALQRRTDHLPVACTLQGSPEDPAGIIGLQSKELDDAAKLRKVCIDASRGL